MFRNLLSRVLVIGAIFAVGATALFPGVAAAEERAFSAMLTGNANLGPSKIPGFAINVETGVGEATHLGRFTWDSVELVDISNFPPHVDVIGTFTMTAADGDLLYGVYTTEGDLDLAGNLRIHGKFTITGGTGRFAAATGGGELRAVASLAGDLPFIGFFDGTIDY